MGRVGMGGDVKMWENQLCLVHPVARALSLSSMTPNSPLNVDGEPRLIWSAQTPPTATLSWHIGPPIPIIVGFRWYLDAQKIPMAWTLRYPILFPLGDINWTFNDETKSCSLSRYLRYQLYH
jgi:hypothetical protein